MRRPDIGFPPIKIDSGENIHVITGVSGELLKVDNEINPIGSVSTPFPSLVIVIVTDLEVPGSTFEIEDWLRDAEAS